MNLKQQDLRLGILIHDTVRNTNTTLQLKHFRELSISEEQFFNRYKPVAITKEILLDFGFENVTEENDVSLSFELESGRKSFRIVKLEPSLWMVIYRVDIGMNFNELTDIEYLHTLQNIVHNLMGEELNISKFILRN